MSGTLLNILFVFVMLVWAAALLLAFRYDLHMLQLSSYQQQGYYRVLRTHPLTVLAPALCAAGVVFFLLIARGVVDSWIIGIPAVLSLIVFFPRKAKKKFVVTARVKRLILALVLLTALTFVLCVLFLPLTGLSSVSDLQGVLLIALGICLALHPLSASLAALLMLPVEKAIQRWYINDAVRMIREHPGLRILGITGSFGKTSVKHYVTALLSEKYSVLMTPGSFNTPMGVVRTIREHLLPTHEIFVCEMGARHVGDIKEICDIVHPQDGILTAIGDQHLETFHTRENIIRTKFELLDAVAADAAGSPEKEHLSFVNGDDANIRANLKNPGAVTYGLGAGNDVRGEIVSVDETGTTFRVLLSGQMAERAGESGDLTVTIPLVGEHNVINVLGAIAVALCFQVPAAKIRMAARRLAPAEHRLEMKRVPYGVLLDDAYNSNPAGAKAAIDAVGAFSGDFVKILVTPGMVELGEKQEEYNAAFGTQAAAVCDLILTVGKTNAAAIARGAKEAGFPEEKLHACATLAEAMNRMTAYLPGRPRVVLLENDLPDDY
ncbi:MAG: UDP-N-acetylmuramoyl-tripeptide--D-alanyl-D-alanine ligase [Lachnospiraceae bacterium]|nr:UDP-N-acetylmuramoyl-tripeptide--D-alanyl-D-alanine ligase [Lachnospiraceae bacterium]